MSQHIERSSITLLVTSEGMGDGDPQLQLKLVTNYLRLLDENNQLPSVICFYTDGVKLVVEGSPVLEELRSLEEKGVWLIVCQTCLNHYSLLDKVQVGVVGGMTDIIEAQWRAEKVITI
jgi:intracellular sulfur oxidation DsrE/DsrF family protein